MNGKRGKSGPTAGPALVSGSGLFSCRHPGREEPAEVLLHPVDRGAQIVTLALLGGAADVLGRALQAVRDGRHLSEDLLAVVLDLVLGDLQPDDSVVFRERADPSWG